MKLSVQSDGLTTPKEYLLVDRTYSIAYMETAITLNWEDRDLLRTEKHRESYDQTVDRLLRGNGNE